MTDKELKAVTEAIEKMHITTNLAKEQMVTIFVTVVVTTIATNVLYKRWELHSFDKKYGYGKYAPKRIDNPKR